MGGLVKGVSSALGLGGDTKAPGRISKIQSQAFGEAADVGVAGQNQILEMLRRRLGVVGDPFQSFIDAGQRGLSGFQDSLSSLKEGSTAGGFGNRVNEIISGDAFGGLVDERQRALQGQLAAGGLTRSGTALQESAAIPTDLAFQIENALTGRQQGVAGLEQNLANTGFAAQQVQTGAESNIFNQILQALGIRSQIEAGGITGAAGANAQGIAGAAQAEQGGIQNLFNLGGTLGAGALAGAFSDPRLKENIRKIGKIGPLDLVEWDWRKEFKGTIVNDFPTMGFLSTQVKEHYPELVEEFGGYDVINYPVLNEALNG